MSEEVLPVNITDIIACDIRNWYNTFKKVTIPSEFIPLPDEFIDFILNKDFFMDNNNGCFGEWTDDSEEDAWVDEEIKSLPEDNNIIGSSSFQEIQERIKKVIDKWEAVFPKLNWSSPKDARWMSPNGTLKCIHPHDVFLLLKSSDTIRSDISTLKLISDSKQYDIEHSMPTLVLRKWHEFRPPYMFRAFVKNDKLIAISQRYINEFWDFLSKEKDEICNKILNFFNTNIENQFTLSSFVFDVYIHSNGKVYLVDIDPFDSEDVDALLFEWDELEKMVDKDNNNVVMKIVESEIGIVPNFQRMVDGVPYEFQNLQTLMKDSDQKDVIEDIINFMNNK